MKRYIILVICFLILASSPGCASGEYQQVNITKQGINFSFSCPVTYQDQETAQNSFEYKSQVVFLRPYGETIALDRLNINTTFSIHLYRTSQEYPDAKAYLNERLVNFSSNPDFKLFELTKMKLDGVDGDYVSYKIRFGLIGEYLDPRISYCKEIYVDYKEKIISVGITYYEDMSAQVEKEFLHIIKSFKFLN
jgi:hypothetical protein